MCQAVVCDSFSHSAELAEIVTPASPSEKPKLRDAFLETVCGSLTKKSACSQVAQQFSLAGDRAVSLGLTHPPPYPSELLDCQKNGISGDLDDL